MENATTDGGRQSTHQIFRLEVLFLVVITFAVTQMARVMLGNRQTIGR